jgi:hypothetical protein
LAPVPEAHAPGAKAIPEMGPFENCFRNFVADGQKRITQV